MSSRSTTFAMVRTTIREPMFAWPPGLSNSCLANTKKTIYEWLRLPDPTINLQQALRTRLAGTGAWLLNGRGFASWKDEPGSFLWLHGIRMLPALEIHQPLKLRCR